MGVADAARRLVDRIGESEALEKPSKSTADIVRPWFADRAAKNLLSGTWLGHRLHPLLTDVVIGSWLSAGIVDLIGGADDESAADRLLETGILAAVPTAAAGLSDYADLFHHGRRVAFVHLLAVDTALALQLASAVARRNGHRTAGKTCSAAALGVLVGAAWLGGHLSYVLGVGVDHTAFDDGPREWEPVAASADVGTEPVVVTAGENEVLLLRVDGQLTALSNRCSHAGWRIADGEISDGRITCPAHGSTFDLRDGSVVRGPAASPQLRYEIRERGGQVEVRGTR